MKITYNKRYEQEFVNRMCDSGHHAERVAGSGSGRHSICDCVLFKDGLTHLVEVKATKFPVFVINKVVREQLQRMIDVCLSNNASPLLAIKFKNRGWKQVILNEIPRKIAFGGEE